MKFDSFECHPIPSQERIWFEQFGRRLMLDAKEMEFARKWLQSVATTGGKASFLEIDVSQLIGEWPSAKIEAQVKMNQPSPKPIGDSFSKGPKIKIFSLPDWKQ